jgi:hypothetical protein
LVDSGIGTDEIGLRFRRSPGHIERVIELAHLPGRAAPPPAPGLRPLERLILGWRARGASHAEIAPRLHHSSAFVARVEDLALMKLATG